MGTQTRQVVPVDAAAWIRWRESILVAQERAAVQAALDAATPDERRHLAQLLGLPALAEVAERWEGGA